MAQRAPGEQTTDVAPVTARGSWRRCQVIPPSVVVNRSLPRGPAPTAMQTLADVQEIETSAGDVERWTHRSVSTLLGA